MTTNRDERRALSAILAAALIAGGALASGCKGAPPAAEGPAGGPAQSAGPKTSVELSAEAIRRNGIRVEPVRAHPVGDFIDAPAEVRLNPDLVAHVAPLVAGQLRDVEVSVGDHVEAGQRLAVLRSVELGQARAEHRRALALLKVAEANFTRQKRLRGEGIASQRSFLQAQLRKAEAEAERDAARARLQVFGSGRGTGPDMRIVAPIGGVVIARHATRGESVGPDDDLFVVADTSRVWVIAHVYERDMRRVRPGARATLHLQVQPEPTWDGVVDYVAPTVDEETRTLQVRVELVNGSGELRPGLFGRLRIAAGGAEPVPALAEEAIQTLRGKPVVFVPEGGAGRFRVREVVIGRRDGGLMEIREGLAVGDRVVVAGAFLLKSQLLSGEFGEED